MKKRSPLHICEEAGKKGVEDKNSRTPVLYWGCFVQPIFLPSHIYIYIYVMFFLEHNGD